MHLLQRKVVQHFEVFSLLVYLTPRFHLGRLEVKNGCPMGNLVQKLISNPEFSVNSVLVVNVKIPFSHPFKQAYTFCK